MKLAEILKKIEQTLIDIKKNRLTGNTSFKIEHYQGGFTDIERVKTEKI